LPKNRKKPAKKARTRQSCCVVMMMESAGSCCVTTDHMRHIHVARTRAHVGNQGRGSGMQVPLFTLGKAPLRAGLVKTRCRLQFHPFGSDRMVESSKSDFSITSSLVSQGRPNRFNQLKLSGWINLTAEKANGS
jgi:hypothetical protein